jgi:protein-tyrosine phosphatase
MDRILFVCLGNICRSPLAHGVAQKIVNDKKLSLLIDSAGTSDWHQGEAPCKHSIEIAAHYNVDIGDQRSRPVSKDDISRFKYVVAMDHQNKADLEILGFEQVLLLGNYGDFQGKDVPDPYFFPGYEGFDKVYNMIASCVEDLMERIENGSL